MSTRKGKLRGRIMCGNFGSRRNLTKFFVEISAGVEQATSKKFGICRERNSYFTSLLLFIWVQSEWFFFCLSGETNCECLKTN